MYLGYSEEGDWCPECQKGTFEYRRIESCSCHIVPPCSACVDSPLMCRCCDFEPEKLPYKGIPIAPGLRTVIEYEPMPLDNSKIDYRSKANTRSSVMIEGVYPDGTTAAEVSEAVVIDRKYGGKFLHFGYGKFVYLAYTD